MGDSGHVLAECDDYLHVSLLIIKLIIGKKFAGVLKMVWLMQGFKFDLAPIEFGWVFYMYHELPAEIFQWVPPQASQTHDWRNRSN